MSTSGTPIRAAPDGRPVDRNGFYLSEDQVDAGVDAAGELLVLTKEQMEIFRSVTNVLLLHSRPALVPRLLASPRLASPRLSLN
jgi:hypothetical protein